MVVTTSSFRRLTEQAAASLGRDDLPIAVTRHPIGGVDHETAAAWADEVVDDVHALLTAAPTSQASRSARPDPVARRTGASPLARSVPRYGELDDEAGAQ